VLRRAVPCCGVLHHDVQAAVKARGWNFCRIDGSVVRAEAQQAETYRTTGCVAGCCAVQAAVKARGWNFCRIDGSVVKAEARQAEVERFQTAPGGTRGIPVFLLTTQVSHVGHREGHVDG
jgi:hypothetical protein